MYTSKIIYYPLSLLILAIVSCKTRTSIDQPQGKVKMETISLAPKIAGRVEKIYVSEGELVHKGDTLVLLDIPEINSKMQQTLGATESAQAQLDLAHNGATAEQITQIDGQLDAAEQQLSFAEQSYKRLQQMYKDSLVSAQQFDEVTMKYKAAIAQVKSIAAKKQEVLKGTRPEQIRMAKGQVVRAQGAGNEVEQAEHERYLVAPTDMRVETIALKEGELALPGYTLINGYENKSLYFRFTIPESKIHNYKVGSPVTVSIPFTSIVIPAKITAIKQLSRYADNTSTSPSYELGETTYELKIIATDSAKTTNLFQNSTVLLNHK